MDNGFEFLEAAATSPLVGATARDKTGVARIFEALQSNMWSNMERRTGPGSGGGMFSSSTLSGPAVSVGGNSSASGSASGAPADNAENEEVEGRDGATFDANEELSAMRQKIENIRSSGSAGSSSNGNDSGASASGNHGSATSTSTSSSISDSINARSSSQGADKEGGKADVVFDLSSMLDRDGGPDIGLIMEQMRAVRERAAGGTMSDEARREAAAAMALKLFELLGDEDDDDDEEEEEEEDKGNMRGRFL